MIGWIILGLFGGLMGAMIYSYYFGTKILGAGVAGLGGTAITYITNVYSNLAEVLQLGYNNFLQSGHWGVSILLVGMVLMCVVMLFNLMTTLSRNPTLIR